MAEEEESQEAPKTRKMYKTIQVRFDVGDRVYMLYADEDRAPGVRRVAVRELLILCKSPDRAEVKYKVSFSKDGGFAVVEESRLFKTKKELLANL